MSEVAIEVSGLGKRYRLGRKSQYKAIRDLIAEIPRRIFRKGASSDGDKSVWALRDIDLTIKQGEVVGIIGRNGSGKSTLLKILSRITDPTEGRARVCGRVGTLLEVGTGFHPELTGRENIFVNGSILGMSRREILRKFDEIVAFSGVEEFLDTPVKHYSSGMRVRLAFSVAAHLEPEILFVDEVLAVGDAAFQKKCLGRMNAVAKTGRTVLFVSHQMESVIGLCQRVIWLDQGQVRADLPAEECVHKYMQHQSNLGTVRFDERTDRIIEGPLALSGISLRNKDGIEIGGAISGEPLFIAFDCVASSADRLRNVEIKAYINDDLGRRLFCAASSLKGSAFEFSGKGTVLCHLPKLPLPPGRYGLSYVVHVNGFRTDKLYDAMYFDVEPGDFFGFGQKISGIGAFYCDQEWTLEK